MSRELKNRFRQIRYLALPSFECVFSISFKLFNREDTKEILATGINELIPVGFLSPNVISESNIRWAASIILSRAFSLSHEDDFGNFQEGLNLVPWADMLNHSSEADKRACLTLVDSLDFEYLDEDEEAEEDDEYFDAEESDVIFKHFTFFVMLSIP